MYPKCLLAALAVLLTLVNCATKNEMRESSEVLNLLKSLSEDHEVDVTLLSIENVDSFGQQQTKTGDKKIENGNDTSQLYDRRDSRGQGWESDSDSYSDMNMPRPLQDLWKRDGDLLPPHHPPPPPPFSGWDKHGHHPPPPPPPSSLRWDRPGDPQPPPPPASGWGSEGHHPQPPLPPPPSVWGRKGHHPQPPPHWNKHGQHSPLLPPQHWDKHPHYPPPPPPPSDWVHNPLLQSPQPWDRHGHHLPPQPPPHWGKHAHYPPPPPPPSDWGREGLHPPTPFWNKHPPTNDYDMKWMRLSKDGDNQPETPPPHWNPNREDPPPPPAPLQARSDNFGPTDRERRNHNGPPAPQDYWHAYPPLPHAPYHGLPPPEPSPRHYNPPLHHKRPLSRGPSHGPPPRPQGPPSREHHGPPPRVPVHGSHKGPSQFSEDDQNQPINDEGSSKPKLDIRHMDYMYTDDTKDGYPSKDTLTEILGSFMDKKSKLRAYANAGPALSALVDDDSKIDNKPIVTIPTNFYQAMAVTPEQ